MVQFTQLWRNDRGSVTVEAAVALTVLVIIASASIAGLATMAAYLAAIDSAGAAARSAAIGVPYQPPAAAHQIRQYSDGTLVTIEVSVPAPLGTMSAQAIFPLEGVAR